MQNTFTRYELLFKIFVVLALIFLGIWIYYIQQGVVSLKSQEPGEENEQEVSDNCGLQCQNEINEIVSQAVATLSAQPKEKVVVAQKVMKNAQTTYIPLTGSFSTNKVDWTDIPTTDVYLVKADYGTDAYFSWDATIRVGYGGGQVFARLFDVTNGIAVDGSEVSWNTQTATPVTSGGLNFWENRNLYRVQIKSLNGWDVFYDTGRIKVYYK